MPGSYEEINYSLRPAKQIERKMICEAIKRLGEFGTIETYKYVGFGSIFFSDFSLIHRKLNITDMLSIEKDEHKQSRFLFNKPFDCIQMQFGESIEILPTIDWSRRLILWLDYDGKLDGDGLKDIRSFCTNAVSGSMLLVTVNAMYSANDTDRISKLREALGAEMVPIDLDEADLAGWRASRTMRRIITSAIQSCLTTRNGGLRAGAKLRWNQVLSFEYADGAKMTTLGGVLVEEGHAPHFSACDFDSLEFVRRENDAYRIDVPSLTYRELRYLDQKLPRVDIDGLELNGIPARDVEKYRELYRYFPTFAEADL